MSGSADGAMPSRSAWQPFTFGGVAAFARAPAVRLILAELVTAIVAGCCVVSFLHRGWSPVVAQIIQQMPESAKIANRRFIGVGETLIAETKFFAIAVTPEPSGQIGQSADFQIQFRPTDFRVGSVFRPNWGWEYDYDPAWTVVLGRSNLEPWWGAWQPVLLTAVGVSVLILLFVIWATLGLVYTVPAKIMAWFADRELSWGGAFRMSSAALLPGAFLVVAAILLYSWQAVDLIGLASLYVAHLLTGWVYVFGGVWTCPRLSVIEAKPNPFVS